MCAHVHTRQESRKGGKTEDCYFSGHLARCQDKAFGEGIIRTRRTSLSPLLSGAKGCGSERSIGEEIWRKVYETCVAPLHNVGWWYLTHHPVKLDVPMGHAHAIWG